MVAAMNRQPATTLAGEGFLNFLSSHGKGAGRSAVQKARTENQKAKGKRQKAKMERLRNERRKREEGRGKREGGERKARSQKPGA
jgi:hypothetical protein